MSTEPVATIIIPAHDESLVIDSCLDRLFESDMSHQWDVVVVANGCTDDTAQRAGQHAGVRVFSIEEASKNSAINVGFDVALGGVVVVLDADIRVGWNSIACCVEYLAGCPAMACRPPYVFDLGSASWVVRSYFRARARLPRLKEVLWGAGVYGLGSSARERLGHLPPGIADDLLVEHLFLDESRVVLDCDPVTVRIPADLRSLLHVQRRFRRGVREGEFVSTTGRTAHELVEMARVKFSVDILIYAAIAAFARFSSTKASAGTWERDHSSRANG